MRLPYFLVGVCVRAEAAKALICAGVGFRVPASTLPARLATLVPVRSLRTMCLHGPSKGLKPQFDYSTTRSQSRSDRRVYRRPRHCARGPRGARRRAIVAAIPTEMHSKQGLVSYLGALLHHWFAFITGGAAAAIAVLVTNALGFQIDRWVFVGVFVWVGIIVAGFKAWDERHREVIQGAADLAAARADRSREIVEHERALAALRADLDDCRSAARSKPSGPRLSLRFDPGDPQCVSTEGGDETFRVKVVNEGDTRATNVSVVLSELHPGRPGLVHQRFHVMKRDDLDVFDVSPRVPVYLDVLYQRQHNSYGHTQIFRLKGAPWFTDVADVTAVLRLEAEVPTEPLELRFKAGDRRRMEAVTVPTS